MLSQFKNVHVLGCGGIGMSAICLLLLKLGVTVYGSDKHKSSLIDDLIEKGLRFKTEDEDLNLEVQVVIYSSATGDAHCQYQMALLRKLPCIHRSEALADLMKSKKALLVAGTHGKTTTSSLLVHALKELGSKPSYAVGGIFSNGSSHADFDDGPYFVAEADESDGSFLNYLPFATIVTNIDLDHMDFWKTPDMLRNGFLKFMSLCKDKKLCIYCYDDVSLRSLGAIGTSYGTLTNSDFRLIFDEQSSTGRKYLFIDNENIMSRGFTNLTGHHNALNSLAVFTLLKRLNFATSKILDAISTFQGVNRRCQIKGTLNRSLWIDDYGHHPTEIKTTIQGIREKYPGQNITVIFQPHRYTRTYDMWDMYHSAFLFPDTIVVTDIYGSGELNEHNLHARDLAEHMSSQLKKTIEYMPRQKLKTLNWESDIIVTFGAGDITSLYQEIACP